MGVKDFVLKFIRGGWSGGGEFKNNQGLRGHLSLSGYYVFSEKCSGFHEYLLFCVRKNFFVYFLTFPLRSRGTLRNRKRGWWNLRLNGHHFIFRGFGLPSELCIPYKAINRRFTTLYGIITLSCLITGSLPAKSSCVRYKYLTEYLPFSGKEKRKRIQGQILLECMYNVKYMYMMFNIFSKKCMFSFPYWSYNAVKTFWYLFIKTYLYCFTTKACEWTYYIDSCIFLDKFVCKSFLL